MLTENVKINHCPGRSLSLVSFRSGRSAQNSRRVQRALARNGAVSSRRNGCGLHRSSFSRITRFEIRFHPNVLIRRQELRPVDPPQSLEFCSWVVNYSNQNLGFLNNLVSSDEAVFSLNSEVNTHIIMLSDMQDTAKDIHKIITLVTNKMLIKYWSGLASLEMGKFLVHSL